MNNTDTRILWMGPKNWLLVSAKKDLLKIISQNLNETDFAVTDLSHSKAIIEIEGRNTKEVLKKGCPFNFNALEKNNSINSTYNGIAFTVDMLDDNPDKIRLFSPKLLSANNLTFSGLSSSISTVKAIPL